jgi:hypothetical protein
MLIKSVKYKGKSLNCLKFKRIIGKNGKLKAENIHVVMTNMELMTLCKKINERFSNEQFLAVKVPKKTVPPKPIKKKPKTVALFGMVDTEIDV